MTTSEKYVRTFHVPWTKSSTKDDKILGSVDHLLGKEIVVSEKVDGGNNTLTSEEVFARSHSSAPVHASNNWIKSEHARLRHLIDPGLSIFVEYTYALHSIWYRRMAKERSYLHVIGVRDDATGIHWSWEDVEMMSGHLGLPTVPILFRGVVHTERELQSLMPGGGRSIWGGVSVKRVGGVYGLSPGANAEDSVREGEVVRVASEWLDTRTSLAKAVRPNHVQSDTHWKDHWRPMHDWSPS